MAKIINTLNGGAAEVSEDLATQLVKHGPWRLADGVVLDSGSAPEPSEIDSGVTTPESVIEPSEALTEAAPKKRTRRTRAQIEADKKAARQAMADKVTLTKE